MGIHDRDYYRESTGGLFEVWSRSGATYWLLAINVIAFLAQAVTRDTAGAPSFAHSPVGEFGIYDTTRIREGEVWRLLTCIFLHSDLWHLAFNMLVLWWAGSRVEELYGKQEFVLFYLGAGVFANVLQLAMQLAGAMPPSLGLGASGAVTAVLVLYACHDPYHSVFLFLVVRVPLWFVVVFYVAMDLMGAAGLGRGGIGYVAHLGGALFGFAYYRSGLRFHHLVPSRSMWKRQPTRPALRVVRPDPEEMDDRAAVPATLETPPPRSAEGSDEPFELKVDRVLDKVSKYGQESLTPEEREILFRASEVYKKRRK